MDGGNGHDIWLSFIQAKYLKEAVTYLGRCPTCKSPKDCQNYYCPLCKVGGLCPITFRGGGEHHQHPWLQVRRQSLQSSVDPGELAKFIGKQNADHIQTSKLNGKTLCYLTRTRLQEPKPNSNPTVQATSSKNRKNRRVNKPRTCLGCKHRLVKPQDSKQQQFLVCCLQCLITAAQQEPEKNLLHLVDGALDLTDEFPRTAIEKTSGPPTSVNSGALLNMEAMFNFEPLFRAMAIMEAADSEQDSEQAEAETVGGSCSSAAESLEVHGRECDPASADMMSRGSGGAEPCAATGNLARAYSTDHRFLQNVIEVISGYGDFERYLGDNGKD